jgi:hypothetical protein
MSDDRTSAGSYRQSTSRDNDLEEEHTPGIEDKTLHRRFRELSAEELNQLEILKPGTTLEQGSVYLDLNNLEAGPFRAIGGQEALPGTRLIAKRDVAYELWNRLVGQEEEVDIMRPETEQ